MNTNIRGMLNFFKHKITNRFRKNKVKKMINEWNEHLIMCPSQIYSNEFIYNSSICYIYLRWREEDPWTAELVKNECQIDDQWLNIDIPFFKFEEHNKLEKYIEDNIEKILMQIEGGHERDKV